MSKNKMTNSIRHFGIDINDIKKSKKFYTEILGFEIIKELTSRHGKKLIFLSLNNQIIELIKHPDTDEKQDKDGSLSHFALDVKNIYKILHDVNKNAQEFGLKLIQEEPFEFNGDLIFFFRGPDNEKIEIMQKTNK
jgi:glyoxylase I family protein